MAYGVKWFSEFDDIQENRVFRVEILERDYAGAATEVQSDGNPVRFEQVEVNDPFQVVRPQKVTINWIANPAIGDFNINDLFITDDRKYQICFKELVSAVFVPRWYGYVIPIDCEEPYHSKPYPVTISGSCGLPFLSDDYYLTPTGEFIEGKRSLATILGDCFRVTGLDLPFEASVHLYAEGMSTGTSPLLQAEIDVDGLRGQHCREILEGILAPFGAFITQSNGVWSICEVEAQANLSVRVDLFNSTGVSLGSETRNQVASFGRDFFGGADVPLISPTSELIETRAQPTSIVTEHVEPGIPVNRLANGTFSGAVFGTIPGWNNRTNGQIPWSRAGFGKPEDPYRLEYYKQVEFDPKKKKNIFKPFSYFDTGPIELNLGDFNIPEDRRTETKIRITGALRMFNALGFSMAVTLNEQEREKVSYLNEDTEWFYSQKEDANIDIRSQQNKYDPVAKTYHDLETQILDIESKRITNYLKIGGQAIVRIRVRIFPGVQGPGYNGIPAFLSVEDLALTIVEGSVFEGPHAYQVDGGLAIRDANENEFTTIIADKIDIITPENGRAVNRVMTGYMTLAGGNALTTGWKKSYDSAYEPIQKRSLRTRIRQMCGERRRIQGTFMGYDFRPNQAVFVDLDTVADPDTFYTVLGWSWDVKDAQYDATLHELNFTELADEDVYLYDDEAGGRGNRMYRGVGAGSAAGSSKGEYEEIVVDPIPTQYFTVGVQSSRTVVLADFIASTHKTYNLTARVISFPDWIGSVVISTGDDELQLNIVISAKPTVAESGFVLVELTGEYIEEDYIVAIPVQSLKPTKIVYTLIDTSTNTVVGKIVNGSAYPLPDSWKIIAAVEGYHDGYYAQVNGPGLASQVTPDPYEMVDGTGSASYNLPFAGSYVSEAGTHVLNFATFRFEGDEDLYALVKRDIIRFTLYDEAFLGKMRFELWVGGSKLGDINPNGSSAFNTEGQPFTVKTVVIDTEHDEIVEDLTSGGATVQSLVHTQDPAVSDYTYDLYPLGYPATAQPEGQYELDALLRLDDEFDVPQDVYSRLVVFNTNKKKLTPVGGELTLVEMVPGTTNYIPLGALSLEGGSFELPANGWNVLGPAESPEHDWAGHRLYQLRGGSLVEIDTSLYTGQPPYKVYPEPVTESEYLFFGFESSLDIDAIHEEVSTFRAVYEERLGGITGEQTAIYSADFSFGPAVDITDTPVDDPATSVIAYEAGEGLYATEDEYVVTLNVKVDDVTIEIVEPGDPLQNYLAVIDHSIGFDQMLLLPGRTFLGNEGVGEGPVAALDLDELIAGPITGTIGRHAKFTGVHVLGDSLLKDVGINVQTVEAQFAVDIADTVNVRGLFLLTDNVTRWGIGKAGIESGGNTGGDFVIWRHDDFGGFLGESFKITRATGVATFNKQVTILEPTLAPLVVSSTALVVNLNTDLLDGQHGVYYLDRANHTGTQLASTISNFAVTVLGTVLTGLSVTNSTISATDTILQAFGKLQGQLTGNISGVVGRYAKFATTSSLNAGILSENGINVTAEGGIFVSNPTPNTNIRGFVMANAAANRWSMGKAGLESGSNTGSDYLMWRYADDGTTVLGTAMTIIRATGAMTLETQLTINGASAPLVVSSSVLVTNFNADLLDGQHGSYYLARANHTGVQAISTITGLQTALDGKVNNFGNGVANRFALWIDADTIANSNLYYNAGNVGVGMVPGYQFDVNGSIRYSNQLASTVGSGTAPIDVTSTTLCVNLNADLLDGQHGSYYLDWNNFTGVPLGNLVQGSNVSLSGTLTNRLIGTGNITIAAVSMPWSGVTGTPNTLSGFGIIDGVTSSDLTTGLAGKENTFSKGNLVQGSGVTLSGTLTNRLVGSGDVTVSVSLPSNIVTGTGLVTRMALWNSGSTITQSGCLIEIGGFQITVAGNLVVEGIFLPPIGSLPASGTEGEFRYSDAASDWYGWDGTGWRKFVLL